MQVKKIGRNKSKYSSKTLAMNRLNFPMKKHQLSSYELQQNTKLTNAASCEENSLKATNEDST